MKPYTKNYLDKTDYNNRCEICNEEAGGIHHILNKNRLIDLNLLHRKDELFNCMALCNKCHQDNGEINYIIPMLFKIHEKQMDILNAPFDREIINKLTKYYEGIY